MVYVREAHPTDGWRMESNDRVGAITAQPKSYEERADVAQKCGQLFNLGFPMLVDTIDDTVGTALQRDARSPLRDRPRKVRSRSRVVAALTCSSRPSWNRLWSCCSRKTRRKSNDGARLRLEESTFASGNSQPSRWSDNGSAIGHDD